MLHTVTSVMPDENIFNASNNQGVIVIIIMSFIHIAPFKA